VFLLFYNLDGRFLSPALETFPPTGVIRLSGKTRIIEDLGREKETGIKGDSAVAARTKRA
jgi:hypothetical protein